MKKDTHTTTQRNLKSFAVVGIGASAGGLDAFKKLVGAITVKSGLAYVLVQHLSPDHESMLPEILQKITLIPVLEIVDEIKLAPDHIYIIPSNKILLAGDGVLTLHPKPDKNLAERSLPIDIFFTSLAEVYQELAIGVILSGAASDGTRGLKAIKENGGVTFAQNEASASFSSMPHSAIEAGIVDFILPPEKMPEKILDIAKQLNYQDAGAENNTANDNAAFSQMLALVRIRKGTDFTYYKQTTIRRRILRRMALHKKLLPEAYLKYLRDNKAEQDALYQDLLIPVTSFFRDSEVFKNISTVIFAEIIKTKKTGDTIRIWLAGCSTGEEVYSMAICIREFLEASGAAFFKVQIFATDISEPAIKKARSATYTANEVYGVTQQQLNNFFIKINDTYTVAKSIRDLCVFAVHNFLKDPPFGKMDVISCRNVLIYMEGYLQKKALTTFHYALNNKGFLLLGKSENVGSVPDLFAAVSKNDKIFIAKNVPGRHLQTVITVTSENMNPPNANNTTAYKSTDIQKTADDLMLSRYTPAGVVVNDAMDILHFRGSTGIYLEPSPGKASFNLMKMAKDGLAFELRNTLHKAKKENRAVIKENVPLIINGVQQNIAIEAVPLPNIVEPHYLILFHSTATKQFVNSGGENAGNTISTSPEEKQLRIQQLEQELMMIREDMRSITEDQEATNEELQSANEELLSGSEELQSLNEELETSKEELQSSNEELIVVNQELNNVNEGVTAARNYAEAIVENIPQPILILDKNFRIKTANDNFYKDFHVNKNDTENKLIFDLGNKQWDIPALRILLEKILPEKSIFHGYEVTHHFESIGLRKMLLNAREIIGYTGSEKLILLSINDITEQTASRKKINESEALFSGFANNIQNLAWIAEADGSIFWYNQLWYNYTGTTLKEMQGWGWQSVHHPKTLPAVIEKWKYGILHGTAVEMTFPIKGADGIFRLFLTRVVPVKDDTGKVIRWIGTNTDVNEQEMLIDKLKTTLDQLRLYEKVVLNTREAVLITEAEPTNLPGPRIIFVNKAFTTITGYTAEDVIGKTPRILQGPKTSRPALDKIKDALKKWQPVETELINYTKDNREFITELEIIPVTNDEGFNTHWVAVQRDVTESKIAELKIKQSETHFRTMAELMPAKINNTDPEARWLYVNKNWLDFTGKGSEELMEFGYYKIMHPDEIEEFKQRFNEAGEKGTDLEMEMRFKNAAGEYKWHLNLASPVKDENGNIKMWIGSTTEIHKIKAEEERKGDFIKMVSHELKTPVTSIKGYVQMLLMKIDNEAETIKTLDIKSPLVRIDKQILNLTRLISEMLDLTRIEASSLQFKMELFSLNNLVNEIAGDILAAHPKHTIELYHDLTAAVFADRDRIGQVLINFINNAIKYSPNSDRIEIHIYQTEHNKVNVSVKDFGIGISKADHQRIFERFYRVDGSNEMTFPGFGIGLFISSSIIKKHKGTITINSEKDKGAEFIFTLATAPEKVL